MNITEKIYDRIELPFFLDVKWGERSTQPVFTNGQTDGRLDEGGVNISSSSTSAIYNGSIYILQYAQLNTPTHQSFQLNPSTVEMTLTFTATDNDSTNDKVIIVVLPFNSDPEIQEDPLYLQKILDINNQKSTGLYSCLPAENENRFAYYSSCIVDPQNPNNSPGNVVVFISLYGTRVNPDTIATLMQLYNATADDFPAFYAPTLLQGALRGSQINSSNYTTQLAASMNAITNGSIVGGKTADTAVRADSLDAYKCVPFDPDSDVKNGTIQIDMKTGKPLRETIGERTMAQDRPVPATGNTWSLSPGKIERFLGNSLGLFLAICFGLIIFYLIIKLFRGKLSPDNLNKTILPGWIQSSPILIVVAFMCALVGFMAGSTLSSGT